MSFCSHATLVPRRPILTLNFTESKRQKSTLVPTTRQFTSGRREIFVGSNATKQISEERSSTPFRVSTIQDSPNFKKKVTCSPIVQNKATANRKSPSHTKVPTNSQTHNCSTEFASNFRHPIVRQQTMDTESESGMQALLFFPKTPDVVLKPVPERSRSENISRIPRPQNMSRNPVSNEVRVLSAATSQWRPVEPNNNQTNCHSTPLKAKSTSISDPINGSNTGRPTSRGISTFSKTMKQPNHSVSVFSAKDTTPKNGRPETTTIVVRDLTNNNESPSRVTIVRAANSDSTVNSDLSDFDDEQISQSNQGSVLLRPKLLNERVWAPMTDEQVHCFASDRSLNFVQNQPVYNAYNRTPINHLYGKLHSSVTNLSSNNQMEFHHPVRRTNERTLYVSHGPGRHIRRTNEFQSNPDLFNVGRVVKVTNVPHKSSPFQGNPNNFSEKDHCNYSAKPRFNFAYNRVPSFVPNTIIEADGYSGDESVSDTESIDPDFYTPRSHHPSDIPFISQPVNYGVEQSIFTNYHSSGMHKAQTNERRNNPQSKRWSMQDCNFGREDKKDILNDNELNAHEISRTEQYKPIPNLPKSPRRITVDYRQRGHLMRRNRMGSRDSVLQSTDRNSIVSDEYEPSDFDPNLSDKFHHDFVDQHRRSYDMTIGSNYVNSKPKSRKISITSSISEPMHTLPEDPGYQHLQQRLIDAQNQAYFKQNYLRRQDPITRRTGLTHIAQAPYGLRPHSLYDDTALFRSIPDLCRSPSPLSPVPIQQQILAPQLTKSQGKRETSSEWDVSRLGLELQEITNLHPDSYIHTRPNIRRGFGGNYTRPNTGLPCVGSDDRVNRSERSLSLERPSSRAHPTPRNDNKESSQHGSPSSTMSQQRYVSNQSNSPLSKVSNRIILPNHRADSSSPHSRTNVNTPSKTGSKLASNPYAPPRITWREKTERERQFDEKLKKLIKQLPVDRQQTVSFVLLMMSINPNEHYDRCRGLEARLREALQLTAPEEFIINKESYVADETGDSFREKTEANGNTNISDSNEDIAHLADPRLTQSCYQSDTTPLNIETEICLKKNHLTNGHTAGSLSTDLNTSTESVSDTGLSSETHSCHRPSVVTVLRRLARCLAVRLACKRHHLANAQQQVARNASEEKWLRNKLNELFNGSEHNSSSNSFSHSQTTLDSGETSIANVISRFDRWHNNTIAAVELLCQLARRLAYLDARIKCVSFQQQAECAWNDSIYAQDPKQCLNELQQHQKQLQAQIKEAQALRANQENCRIRLLDSIPAGLKMMDESCFLSSSPKLSDSTTVPNGTNGEKYAESGVNSVTTSEKSSTRTVLLRDRIASHLSNTLQGLVTFHVLDTEIRMDQDLWDHIQDEQRLEVNY